MWKTDCPLRKLIASPEGNTLLMHSGNERSLRREPNLPITPDLATSLLTLSTIVELRFSFHDVMPKNLRLGAIPRQELLATLWVSKPVAMCPTVRPCNGGLWVEVLCPRGNFIKVV